MAPPYHNKRDQAPSADGLGLKKSRPFFNKDFWRTSDGSKFNKNRLTSAVNDRIDINHLTNRPLKSGAKRDFWHEKATGVPAAGQIFLPLPPYSMTEVPILITKLLLILFISLFTSDGLLSLSMTEVYFY